jgi:hypothetical protein
MVVITLGGSYQTEGARVGWGKNSLKAEEVGNPTDRKSSTTHTTRLAVNYTGRCSIALLAAAKRYQARKKNRRKGASICTSKL